MILSGWQGCEAPPPSPMMWDNSLHHSLPAVTALGRARVAGAAVSPNIRQIRELPRGQLTDGRCGGHAQPLAHPNSPPHHVRSLWACLAPVSHTIHSPSTCPAPFQCDSRIRPWSETSCSWDWRASAAPSASLLHSQDNQTFYSVL